MRRYRDHFKIRSIAYLNFAAALLVVVTAPASAQRAPSGGSPASKASSGGNRTSAQTGVEQELRLRGDVKDNTPVTEDKLREILQELKEDFERIQAISENIMLMLKANDGLSYTRVTDLTAEIGKRARRFRDNANFPPPAPAPKDDKKLGEIGQAQQMKDALSILSERVNRFVDNALFQSPTWTDAQLSARANRDLETIIEMSSRIKKSAEKLGKSIQ